MKEKPSSISPFFGIFSSDHIPNVSKDTSVHTLLKLTIPFHYTSEFRELFGATPYYPVECSKNSPFYYKNSINENLKKVSSIDANADI